MKSMPLVLLSNEDGNAFSLLVRFKRAARKADWTECEIGKVRDEAMSGDYDHFLQTIMDNSEEPVDSV